MELICLFILLFIIVLQIVYRVKIIFIRVFGFELSTVLIYIFILIYLIGEFILPMPQYYIKHQDNKEIVRDLRFSLNKILEEEVLKSEINFDAGSFKIINSQGMNFNHLFLCSYQINGKEEVRVFIFEKNILGNMKPKYPFGGTNIISKDNDDNDFYKTYVNDGILGEYMIIAGFASEEMVLEDYRLNNFIIEEVHPFNYFMWVELVSEPWKLQFVWLIKVVISGFILGKICNKNLKPIKFYYKWKKGDAIFKCIKEEDNI